MQINKLLYIPDQETYIANQKGALTTSQKNFFFESEPENIVIQNRTSDFVYSSGKHIYTFRDEDIDFSICYDPLLKQKAVFLPCSQYQIFALKTENDKEIFLSAKLLNSEGADAIYRNMVHNLATVFYFSLEHLEYNKMNELSPRQLKKYRKGLKEYDPDPRVKSFEFVFVGEKTKELCPFDEKYIKHISSNFHNLENVLLLNIRYRIYYEDNNNNFLSMEPIEIVNSDFCLPYLTDYFNSLPTNEKIYLDSKQKITDHSATDSSDKSSADGATSIAILLLILGIAGLANHDKGCLSPLCIIAAFAIFITAPQRIQKKQK